MTRFTIIGYKESGTDSVMGCVQDTVDSDFFFEIYNEMTSAVKSCAELSTEEIYSKYLPHKWQLTILYDGVDEENILYIEDDTQRLYYEDIHNQFNTAYILEIDRIKDEKIKAAKKILKEKQRQAKRKKTLANKKIRNEELALLKSLKEKYNEI